MLAGFRIEGRARAGYVDLEGERSENDRVLFSIQEAARRFGMSTSTIRRWIEAGHLEAFRLEGDRRVYVAIN
ncbi:MAG: MerR family DNA-binding transcriptional regulator [Actinomycetota bacterium]